MDLTIAWLAVPAGPRCPLRRAAACWSSGSSESRFRALCVPAVGFAAIVVVAQLPTLWDATAELTVPIVVALGARRASRCRGGGGGAPSRGPVGARRSPSSPSTPRRSCSPARRRSPATSSSTTRPPGWRSPTGSWSTAAASPASPRRPTRRPCSFNLGDGYPIGVFLPLGVARALVGPGRRLADPALHGLRRRRCSALALWQLAGADRPPAPAARGGVVPRRALGASVRLLPVGRHQGGRAPRRSSRAPRGWRGSRSASASRRGADPARRSPAPP